MTESRKKADWQIVASLVLASAFIPLALYAAGYLGLSSRTAIPVAGAQANGTILRTFSARWQAKIYKPVAKLEERAVGKEVILAWMDE